MNKQAPISALRVRPIEERFLHEYLANQYDGQKAAMAMNMDAHRASEFAAATLCKFDCKIRLKELIRQQHKQLKMTSDEVIRELAAIGFSDLRDYFKTNDDGHLVPKGLDELDENAARALRTIKITHNKDGSVTYEPVLHDKIDALNILAKHHNLFAPEAAAKEVHIKVIRLDPANAPTPLAPLQLTDESRRAG